MQNPPPSKDKASHRPTARSRELRQNATDAERLLWLHLSARKVAGIRFNRQFPIGPFIGDFVSRSAKLVIELDGGHHAEQVEADARRTAYLKVQGYRVIRFWNNDVLGNVEGVVLTIVQILADIPSPGPSRKREGSSGAANLPSRLREGPGEGVSKPRGPAT